MQKGEGRKQKEGSSLSTRWTSDFCFLTSAFRTGAVAQLGEHLLCKQGVVGSIPISSTSYEAGELEGRSKRKGLLLAFRPDLRAAMSGVVL